MWLSPDHLIAPHCHIRPISHLQFALRFPHAEEQFVGRKKPNFVAGNGCGLLRRYLLVKLIGLAFARAPVQKQSGVFLIVEDGIWSWRPLSRCAVVAHWRITHANNTHIQLTLERAVP